jgi:hypothetical protein
LEAEPFDVAAWLAKLDDYVGVPFPDAVDDPAVLPDNDIRFD